MTLKSTSAMTRKLMMAPTKVPRPRTTASVPAASSAARRVMFSASVLGALNSQASSGVMTLPTRELVMAPKAPPTMTPMAMSRTLPLVMKALNSSKNFFICFLSCSYLFGTRIVFPPIYGVRTAGMVMLPSACRWFSRKAMSIRGGATTVLLRVWGRYILPSPPLTRIFSRLA